MFFKQHDRNCIHQIQKDCLINYWAIESHKSILEHLQENSIDSKNLIDKIDQELSNQRLKFKEFENELCKIYADVEKWSHLVNEIAKIIIEKEEKWEKVIIALEMMIKSSSPKKEHTIAQSKKTNR